MIKRLLLACVLGAMAWTVSAEPALSCDEVDQVGSALTDLGTALDDENAQIGEGSEEDQALADIITALADISEAENDEDLANASSDMADAWAANDRDAFLDALADAVVKLAVVSNADCQ